MKPLTRYSEARLPTRHGEFRLLVYRAGDDPDDEHVAMVHGDVRGAEGVLCRVHSECFTGEVLGSLRCDCRQQLDRALERIARDGRGVLVYLRQEGRGIGLGNKVRAYALQDQGIDTVEANLALGFDADLRSYEMAVAIVQDLGVASVRLMTNNPDKLAGLAHAGIKVVSHESHWVESSGESAAYLQVKQDKLGHIAPVLEPIKPGQPGGSDDPGMADHSSRPNGATKPVDSIDSLDPAHIDHSEKDASPP